MRRALAAGLLAAGFALGGPGVAVAGTAAPAPTETPSAPTEAAPAASDAPAAPAVPSAPEEQPTDVAGPGIIDTITSGLPDLCPNDEAPIPAFPDGAAQLAVGGSLVGGPPVLLKQPLSDSLYQQYGYAGLYVTTYEAGCFQQIKTSGKRTLQEAAYAIDSLVTNVSVGAYQREATDPIDAILPEALENLKDAFWGEWVVEATIVSCIFIGLAGLRSRSSETMTLAVNMLVVLAAVPWVLGNASLFTTASDAATVGVANRTGEYLLGLTPGGAGQDPGVALGDGFYAVGYRSWLEDSCLGVNPDVAREFGPRFVAAQAWSYPEVQAMADGADQAKMVEEKANAWVRTAQDLESEHPAVFACWAQGGQDSAQPAFKHLAVSVFGGFWDFMFSMGVLAVRFVLRFAWVLLAAYAVVMVVSAKLTSRFVAFAVMGIVGPAMVAALSSAMKFFFYAIISDPETAWWQAIVAGLGLGFAAIVGIFMLAPALPGFAIMFAGMRAGRRGRGLGRNRGGGGGQSFGNGAAAGAAAGAATTPGGGGGGSTAPSAGGGGVDEPSVSVPEHDPSTGQDGSAGGVDDMGLDWRRFGEKAPEAAGPGGADGRTGFPDQSVLDAGSYDGGRGVDESASSTEDDRKLWQDFWNNSPEAKYAGDSWSSGEGVDGMSLDDRGYWEPAGATADNDLGSRLLRDAHDRAERRGTAPAGPAGPSVPQGAGGVDEQR